MKQLLTLLSFAASFAALAGSVVYKTEKGSLDPNLSHVQGVCFDGENYYLSQDGAVLKCDKAGKLVRKVPAIVHTGDIAYRDGKIYAAVAVSKGPNAGKGIVHVYDTNLKLLKERIYERGFDGIELLGDNLYIGRGSHLETIPVKAGEKPHSSMPHRENEVWILDPVTLDVKSKHIIDTGYRTLYGTQNIVTDGKHLYFAFYPANKKDPGIGVFDAQLNLVRIIRARGGNGLVYDDATKSLHAFRTHLKKGELYASAIAIPTGERSMRTEANETDN